MGGSVDASAGVSFGTKVQVLSLYGAAKAFEQAGGAFATLPYIARYKARGKLAPSGSLGDAVGRVPVEVWELVLHAVREIGAHLAEAAEEQLEDMEDEDQAIRTLFRYNTKPLLKHYELQAEWPRDIDHLADNPTADDTSRFDEDRMGTGCSLSTWTLLRPRCEHSRLPFGGAESYHGGHETKYTTFSLEDLTPCLAPRVLARLERFFGDWPCQLAQDQPDLKPRFVLEVTCDGYE
ncbi:hypothetical protein JCM10207_004992 [Rhodosporidiobolus poonsookiae]